uniref:Fibrinogen C-terminal domain-containing protein n=1 Tax=Latimeria chalumnae TaxID=7897 RepID=H3BAX3_LATCH
EGTDCSDIKAKDVSAVSGVYVIQPLGAPEPFQVFCEMCSFGGWTVIQRHNGQNDLNFRRRWNAYKQGFGTLLGEHWLGLEKMYLLTNQLGKSCKLRVDIGDFEGATAYAKYDDFKIGTENDHYRLQIGSYSGNAGDAFRGNSLNLNQNNMKFSTYDRDNDGCSPCIFGDIAVNSCSREISGGGWWFNQCGMADLNGDWHPQGDNMWWQSAVYWETWNTGMIYSLKYSEMKLSTYINV